MRYIMQYIMQLRKLKLLIFTAGLLCNGKFAIAACESMSLSNVSTYVSLNTNNFAALDIQVSKGSGTCNNFFIVMDNGGAYSYANRTLQSSLHNYPIQFYKDAARNQIFKSENEVSASEVLAGTFVGGATTFNTNYYAYIDVNSNQYRNHGHYTNNFYLRLYEGDLNNKILRDTKVVQFGFTHYKLIDISLVSTGAAFNLTDTSQSIDFGQLTEGLSREFDIVMQYNAGYNLSMTSANDGKLKHLTAQKFVPYTLVIDGVAMALSSIPTLVKSSSGLSLPNGTRVPVSVKIGKISDSIPGIYTDTITINVSSSE